MNDDFNTPILIAQLFEGVKYINQINDGTATVTEDDLSKIQQTFDGFVTDVLGININEKQQNTHQIEGLVSLLIAMRNQARTDKNWALSDQIRDQLANLGILLKDSKEGTTYTIQN